MRKGKMLSSYIFSVEFRQADERGLITPCKGGRDTGNEKIKINPMIKEQ